MFATLRCVQGDAEFRRNPGWHRAPAGRSGNFPRVRIALLDDHMAFRDSLRVALVHHAAIEVAAEASSSRTLSRVLEAQPLDLVVADMLLEDTDGVSAVRELRRRGLKVPTMILTAFRNQAFARDAFAAGVEGFALKAQPLDEVVDAMRRTAAGERYVSPLLQDSPSAAPGGHAVSPVVMELSWREREIFWLLIRGHSSQAIARSLCISLKTVETHRSHINRKLGVHSSADLMRLAARNGLLADRAE
jgi:two-component system response regulator NreC